MRFVCHLKSSHNNIANHFLGSLNSQSPSMAPSKSENDWPKSELVYHVDDVQGNADEKLGTPGDQRDMIRMGKKQELRRDFQFFSIWGFAVLLGCSWEYVFMSVALSVGFDGVSLSLAETSAATASCRFRMEALQEACGYSFLLVAACFSLCFVSALVPAHG